MSVHYQMHTNESYWYWWETWSPSTPEHPRECEGRGWKCGHCGIDLKEYLEDNLSESMYLDNPELPPKLKFCPACGRQTFISEE